MKGVLQNNEQVIHNIIMVSQSELQYIGNVYVDYFVHSVILFSQNNDKIE